MNTQTNECDRERLNLLLTGQLSEAEQLEAARHLDSCDTCQRELEHFAADTSWWSEAGTLLRPHPDDPERSDDVNGSLSCGQLLSTDELEPVEFTLDFLEPSDNPAMIGRLGEYEILELIGRGGMGVVLKGYQRELNRYVAVKVMAPHYASSGAARKRFAREAQAAAAVVHPHVVAIHSVDAKAKLPYLVMPYVAGKSLQARLDDDGPLELKEILRVGKQAAEGLAAAHAQGLVHRDIKPANILLEDDIGRVLLTDFGLARAVDDASMTRSSVIAGTPQYMSPEQANGQAIDSRADLFSLGSVLYAMCAGHPPFRAETTMGILRRICEETPRPICDVNADMPAWLGRVIEKLLAKNPAERFQSAAEVAELLGNCLAHVQQPHAEPLPKILQDPPSTRRPRRLRLAALLSALVGCLILAAVFGNLFGGLFGDDDESERAKQRETAGQNDGRAERKRPPAADPNLKTLSSAEEIERLVQQLDNDDFQTRQGAMSSLIKIGKPAIGALTKAADSRSTELRFRAKEALLILERAMCEFIDLGPKSNTTLKKKFGRFDGNTLESLPTGEQVLGGTRFRVANEIMFLGSKMLPDLPRKIENIAVGRKCTRFHFLHSMGFGSDQGVNEGEQVAKYVIRYADDTREEISIEFGVDYRDFWDTDKSTPAKRGKVVWTGKNRCADGFGCSLRLYASSWRNPHPEKEIESFDFVATHEIAAPFLLAITVDNSSAVEKGVEDLLPAVNPAEGQDNSRKEGERQAKRARHADSANASIRRSIEGLSSAEFQARREATQALVEAGAPAIPALIAAAYSDDAEVRFRVNSVLDRLSKSTDATAASKARLALRVVKESPDAETARRGFETLVAKGDVEDLHRFTPNSARITLVVRISHADVERAKEKNFEDPFHVTNGVMTDLIRAQAQPKCNELGFNPNNIGLPLYSDEVPKFEKDEQGYSGKMTFDLYNKR